ncbi:hypothetical protein F2P56_000500, partial [Juglans regia]
MEVVRVLFGVWILVSWVLISVLGEGARGALPCDFPAIYNFGDSNSDTGGIFAAFYPAGPPSGETFFHQPAGRGSGGRLIIDFIAKGLGLPYLSAYLDSVGTSFRHGANFATGGSTIRRLNESYFVTGVSPFSLDIQIVQFGQFRARTSNLYNQAKKDSQRRNLPRPEDFSKALYTFDIGQNDIAAGFRTMSNEQFKAVIPDIIGQFAAAVQVSHTGKKGYFIAEHLSLPYLSAYLNSLATNYRHGANFATGGSTIRRQNETIFEYGISPFSLDIQIIQFIQFKTRTNDLYNQAKTPLERSNLPRPQDYSKALYTFDIGQNDLSVGFRKLSFDQLRAAMPDIVNQLATAVQRIYQQGGRAFWIHNTGPIGCLPVNLFYIQNPPAGYLDQYG